MMQDLQAILETSRIFDVSEMDELLSLVKPYVTMVPGKRKLRYVNIPIAFDTEFSSFYDADGKKVGLLYAWMIGICGYVLLGRTIPDMVTAFDIISDFFHTSGKVRCVVYVHFLGADFEYIRKYFEWSEVFAMEPHNPIYAVTTSGIEFRCSYHLSGYSLERVGDKLHKYHVTKRVGDLDYEKIRTPETPLTETELGYCANDVKVVCAYIQEEIERNNNDITQIPLTKTGYVRRYARNACFSNKLRYQSLMRSLTIEPLEFRTLQAAFQGGFTHANPANSCVVWDDVHAIDLSSSYPAVLASERFPMGKGKQVRITSRKQFAQLLREKHCVFEIDVTGLHSRLYFDSYISLSKCRIKQGVFEQNGRVVFAKRITTTITEIDWMIINTVYHWDHLTVGNVWVYDSDYLPTPFVHAMLTLYQQKTVLKGIEGKEYEYQKIKEDQNSFYGMTVTSPIRDIIPYDDDWGTPYAPELTEALSKYNASHERFLFYPWGVYTTAYARRNVWTAILECRDDHIYTDTDSEKFLNLDAHQKYIDMYNDGIQQKLRNACKCHGIDYASYCRPKNQHGVEKPLGNWDYEAHYKRFKTLGAKRYMYELDNGEIHFTVAGLKKSSVNWLVSHHKNPFEAFDDGMTVPVGESGRITHTYINDKREGTVTDYLGNTYDYMALTGLHMEPSEYSLSMSEDYISYIMDMHDVSME